TLSSSSGELTGIVRAMQLVTTWRIASLRRRSDHMNRAGVHVSGNPQHMTGEVPTGRRCVGLTYAKGGARAWAARYRKCATIKPEFASNRPAVTNLGSGSVGDAGSTDNLANWIAAHMPQVSS